MSHIKVSISKEMYDSIDRLQVFLTIPLPVGVHLKVSPEGPHTFYQLLFPTA